MSMSEWQKYKLGEVYSFSSGLSKSSDQFGYGFDFLTFKDVFNNYFLPDKLTALVNSTEKERQTCSIKRGDVFLTRTSETDDELGMSSVALKDYPNATFNGFTKRLRPIGNVEIYPEFVAYYFRSPRFRANIVGMSSITTRASLNNSMLAELPLLLPNYEEQVRIATILKSLDDKIDLLHRENTTLEAMAETLFRQWFIEEAKEDWEEGQLGDVCLYVTEKIDISNVDVDTYFSTENMCPNKQGVVEASSIPENVKVTKYIYDDILLSNIRPYFKKIWLADRNGACSNDVLCIRSKSEDLKYFTYYTIRQDDFFDYVMLGAKGCKMPRGDKQHIMNWSIIIPTNDVLRRFNTIVENGMAKIRNNNKQIQTLVQTRDSLFSKLMCN